MKKRKKSGPKYHGDEPKMRRLYSIDASVVREFMRITKEKKYNMSGIVEKLIHEWIVKNQNALETP